jgi:hypothetical protein
MLLEGLSLDAANHAVDPHRRPTERVEVIWPRRSMTT